MDKRLKAMGILAVTGFLLGVAANLIYFNVLPILARLFPHLLQMTWVIWGLIGASLSVAGCLVYAYLPEI